MRSTLLMGGGLFFLSLGPVDAHGQTAALASDPPGLSCRDGWAVDLDGDTWATPHVILSPQDNFTMEVWVQPSEEHQIDPVGRRFGGHAGQKYALAPTRGTWFGPAPYHGGAGLSVGTNGVSVYENGGLAYQPVLVWQGALETWTHVAVVYEDRVPYLYVDGAHVATGTPGPSLFMHPGGTFEYGIGAHPYGTYVGALRDVRIWDHARTQDQILDDMHGRADADPGMVLWYPIDEGLGSVLFEAAAGHDASFNRAPHWTCFHPPAGPDSDGDGIPNDDDACPDQDDPDQADFDGDGLGDACDPDDDNDQVPDDEDTCPLVANSGVDSDSDRLDNACDEDDDGDQVPDGEDACPLVPNSGVDFDTDGVDDACDADDDGDDVSDGEDVCPESGDPRTDAHGCTGEQRVAQACDPDEADNHGQYVRCVVAGALQAVHDGLLTRREALHLIRAAAHHR